MICLHVCEWGGEGGIKLLLFMGRGMFEELVGRKDAGVGVKAFVWFWYLEYAFK